MAYVRWRKGCAGLLMARYAGGRSHQVLIANPGDGCTCPVAAATIEAKLPGVKVDGQRVNLALARGGKGNPELPVQHLRLARVAHMLGDLAQETCERVGGSIP